MSKLITLKFDKRSPTHRSPRWNKDSSHVLTPDIKIAAVKYFVAYSNPAIKQKITPVPLLFILFTSCLLFSIPFGRL